MSKEAIREYFTSIGLEKLFKDKIEKNPKLFTSLAKKVSTGRSIAEDLRPILDYASSYVPLTNDVIDQQFNLTEIVKEYNKGKSEDKQKTVAALCDIYKRSIIGNEDTSRKKLEVSSTITPSELEVKIKSKVSNDKKNKNDLPLLQILIYKSNDFKPENLVGLNIVNVKYSGIKGLRSVKNPINIYSFLNTQILNKALKALNNEINDAIKDVQLSHENLTPSIASLTIFRNVLQKVNHTAISNNINNALVRILEKRIADSTIASIGENDNRVTEVRKRKDLSDTISKNTALLKLNVTSSTSAGESGILKILNIGCIVYVQDPAEANQALAKLVESPAGSSAYAALVKANILKKDGKKLLSIKTSPSYPELVEKTLEAAVKGKKYKHTSKSSATISNNIKINPTEKNNSKKQKQVKVEVRKKTAIVKPSGQLSITATASSSGTSLSEILTMLQTNIRAQVKQNMVSPRLIYRTGRFADSVKISNVTQSSKGLYTITYGYATYPYQTFEPGYEQGSAKRDPRSLIRLSIRELVAKQIGDNFKAVRLGGIGSRGKIE